MSVQLSAPGLIVERARPAQARTLYPLMRSADSTLRLPDWVRYARSMTSGAEDARQGILIAWRRPPDIPIGAVCYRRDKDPVHGAILSAEHFVAMDLLYPEAVLKALMRHLERVARHLRCPVIRSIVHPDRADLVACLKTAGNTEASVAMTRKVAPEETESARGMAL